jgi:hypothetical protein
VSGACDNGQREAQPAGNPMYAHGRVPFVKDDARLQTDCDKRVTLSNRS